MNIKISTLILVLLVAAYIPGVAHAQSATMQPRLEHQSYRIALKTGIDLHYIVQGTVPPPGAARIDEAMILVHGYSDSWRTFEEMLARLPLPEYNVPVFALDMRGHGGSSESASGSYTQGDFADDIAAFMDALGIQKGLIVGHSMGGLIAHQFAVTYPDRVKGLVLIATSASLAGEPVADEVNALVAPFPDDEPAPAAFVEEFQASTFAEPPAPQVLHRYVAESLHLSGLTWKRTAEGMGTEDHRDRLPDVKAPVLILWGDNDAYFTRKQQDELIALLPDARLVVYPGAGHALNVERAGKAVEDMRDFIQAAFAGVETSSR